MADAVAQSSQWWRSHHPIGIGMAGEPVQPRRHHQNAYLLRLGELVHARRTTRNETERQGQQVSSGGFDAKQIVQPVYRAVPPVQARPEGLAGYRRLETESSRLQLRRREDCRNQ